MRPHESRHARATVRQSSAAVPSAATHSSAPTRPGRHLSAQQRLLLDLDAGRLEEATDHVVVADQQDQLGSLARPVALDNLLERLVGEPHVPADLVGYATDQVRLLVEARD